MHKDYIPKCRYFAQGRCSYGNKCRFSHQGFQQIYLLRHAQSIFNAYSDKLDGVSFTSFQAKELFQLNQQLIDCGLTEKGVKQAQKVQIPSDCYIQKKRKKQGEQMMCKYIDLVFVSPLNRALQTARLILKRNKIKTKKIIILPQLSQVLSKVCDFSMVTQQKKKKYSKFSFDELDNLEKLLSQKNSFWQDLLLDKQHHKQILFQQSHGSRYMKILDKIFPTPLESSQNCFKRSILALQKIKSIAKQQEASKILIVSHNRILKYMAGRDNSGRAPSLQNCQFRKIVLQID